MELAARAAESRGESASAVGERGGRKQRAARKVREGRPPKRKKESSSSRSERRLSKKALRNQPKLMVNSLRQGHAVASMMSNPNRSSSTSGGHSSSSSSSHNSQYPVQLVAKFTAFPASSHTDRYSSGIYTTSSHNYIIPAFVFGQFSRH